VEMSDRVSQRQAEPGTRVAPARIQPDEAAACLRTKIGRNPRPAISNFDPRPFAILVRGQHNLTALACIFDRIFDEVADRLRE